MSLLLLLGGAEEKSLLQHDISWRIGAWYSTDVSWLILQAIKKNIDIKNSIGVATACSVKHGLGLQLLYFIRDKIEGIYPTEIKSALTEAVFFDFANKLLQLGAKSSDIVNCLGYDPSLKSTDIVSRVLTGEPEILVDIVSHIVRLIRSDKEIVNYVGERLMREIGVLNSILDINPAQLERIIRNTIGSPDLLHWGDFKLKADAGPWSPTGDWDIRVDGASIKDHADSVRITMSESHFTNSFEASVQCINLWDNLEPDGSGNLRVEIKIGIDSYLFMLEMRKLSGDAKGRAITIWGRGKTAALGEPYSQKLEDEYVPAGMATEVIQSLASAFVLDFQIDDYFIPAETLQAAGKTPLTVISEIARAGGGIVRCGKQGELIVRAKHPFNPDTLEQESPAWSFSDIDNVLELQEEWVQESGYNGILVQSDEASMEGGNVSGTIVIDADLSGDPLLPGSPLYVRVYLLAIPDSSEPGYPYNFYELRVTDGSAAYRGTITREETEVVQIVSKGGSTRYPIAGITSYEWIGINPGTIEADPEGENKLVLIPSDTRSEGLLRVTYQTVYDSWQLTGIDENSVLILAAKEI